MAASAKYRLALQRLSERLAGMRKMLTALLCNLIAFGFVSGAYGLTIPASEDTVGHLNKLTTGANAAPNLMVDATHTAFLYFNLHELPQKVALRWAKPRLFLPSGRVAIPKKTRLKLPVPHKAHLVVAETFVLTIAKDGFEGRLELMKDSRLTEKIEKEMGESGFGEYGVPGEPSYDPQLIQAKARLRDAMNKIVGETKFECALVSCRHEKLHSGFRTFLFTEDKSTGMGSYSGPFTGFFQITNQNLNPIMAKDVDSGKYLSIRLSETGKSCWRFDSKSQRMPYSRDVISISCSRDDDSGLDADGWPPFITFFSRFHWTGSEWLRFTRKCPGMFENEGDSFEELSSFPPALLLKAQDKDVISFVIKWIADSASNSPEKIISAFGDKVDYCYAKSMLSRDALTKLEVRFQEKYPLRKFTNFNLRDLRWNGPHSATIKYMLDYKYEGVKDAQGTTLVELKVERQSKDWKIVRFREKVDRRDSQAGEVEGGESRLDPVGTGATEEPKLK